jgi:hypothetical protein
MFLPSVIGATKPNASDGVLPLINLPASIGVSAPQGNPKLQPRKPAANPMAGVQNMMLNGQTPGSPNPLLGVDISPVSSVPLDGGPADLATLSQMADPGKLKSGGVFGSGLSFGDILANGVVGFAAGMGNPGGLAALNALNDAKAEREERRARLAELGAKRFEPMQLGSSIIQRMADGSYQTLFTAPPQPEPFEVYAQSRGFTPGTPEYADEVQNYRLGAWSDPAMEAKSELEGIRYGHRDDLQDQRLAVTRRGQDVRASNTRRGQDLTDARVRRSQNMTDARVRGSAGYQGRGGKPAGGSDLIGPVYVKDGKRIQFSKSRNQYVPVN